MTLYLATLGLGYILGVLSTVAIYRYGKRRSRRMPFTPRDESSVSAFIRRHAVAAVLIGVILDVVVTAACFVSVNVLLSVVHRQGNDEAQSKDQIACQRHINRQLVNTLRNRAKASREAVLAPQPFLHTLLPLLTSPNATDKERKAMFQALVRATREANNSYDRYQLSQQLNPLPALPDCSKGEQ